MVASDPSENFSDAFHEHTGDESSFDEYGEQNALLPN